MVLAFFTVLFGSTWFAKKRGFPLQKTFLLLFLLGISAILGARLLHFFTDPSIDSPENLFKLTPSGFSLYGGILTAIFFAVVLSPLFKISFWKLADTVVPFLGIGIALMRLGCFSAGCCFGEETNLPWGVTFPVLSDAHLYQISQGTSFFSVHPVHPTQLYELFAAFFVAFFSAFLICKKAPQGMPALAFALFFTLFRLFNDEFRAVSASFVMGEWFYPLLYGGIICGSLIFLLLLLFPLVGEFLKFQGSKS